MTDDDLNEWEHKSKDWLSSSREPEWVEMTDKEFDAMTNPAHQRILILIKAYRVMGEALVGVLGLIESGKLVGDISNYHNRDWALGALDIVTKIKAMHDALEAVDGGKE